MIFQRCGTNRRVTSNAAAGDMLLQLFALVCLATFPASVVSDSGRDYASMKGHLQPFGESGPRLEIMEVGAEYPEAADFLKEYVAKRKPLKLTGLIKDSTAVRLWTDDYLLTLDVPADSTVKVETKKKENRTLKSIPMHFHEFLKIYNKTEHYMVDNVPPYLAPHLNLPCLIQCPEVRDTLTMVLMWFSSGGTKSVIHTDDYDNLNCVIRGEKTFVMMDPKYKDKIELLTQGAYSTIDVDSVDLTKYPDLADVEFYHVNLTAGDCFFIPYKWIHQVRSFGSNVAVNFWWDHFDAVDNLKTEPEGSVCEDKCDPSLTLHAVHIPEEEEREVSAVRTFILGMAEDHPLSFEAFDSFILESIPFENVSLDVKGLIRELFETLDVNKDGEFSKIDQEKLNEELWDTIQELLNELNNMSYEEEEAHMEEYADLTEKDRRDEL